MRKKLNVRRGATLVVGLLVSATLLYVTLSGLSWEEVRGALGSVAPERLVWVLVADAVGFAMMAARSKVLLRSVGRFRTSDVLSSILIGYAGNNLLPFRAGELVRVRVLTRAAAEASGAACLSVVALEKVLDAAAVFSLFGVAALMHEAALGRGGQLALVGGVIGLALGAVVVVRRRPKMVRGVVAWMVGPLGERVGGRVLGLVEQALSALSGPRSWGELVSVIGCTYANWLATACSIYVWFWAFGVGLPWHAAFYTMGLLALGMFLPSSPGNVGTFEYFASAAIRSFGVAAPLAATIALVGHVAGSLPYTLVGVALYLAWRPRPGVGAEVGEGLDLAEAKGRGRSEED